MTQPPSTLFGPLFEQVQERTLFADSKTFADAEPRRAPEAILRDWAAAGPLDDSALLDFVRANFDLPADVQIVPATRSRLDEYIVALWPMLTRAPVLPGAAGSALPEPYVVPGGRFRELYYWDSYFTMLGLVESGRQDLVEDMICNFGSLLDRFGHIPNGTRSYYLSRSQPPVFYLMAALSDDRSPEARRQRLDWMRIEHGFWMAGENRLALGAAHRRVVRLADGAVLNRYWDDRSGPRDESWREDVALAREVPEEARDDLWRNLRAACESGWDFSSRWLGDGQSLVTIRTTRLLPIDLNALLFGLEQAIAGEAGALGLPVMAAEFNRRANARRAAIERHFWQAEGGFYADYDLDVACPAQCATAAQAFALFANVASAERAALAAEALERLIRPGGLVTTGRHTPQQWDAPNGWAPLQWVAIEGLRTYGENALAGKIAERWLAMIERNYLETGQLVEKYDVERGGSGGGGEYPLEIGFGWTNGVTLALIRSRR